MFENVLLGTRVSKEGRSYMAEVPSAVDFEAFRPSKVMRRVRGQQRKYSFAKRIYRSLLLRRLSKSNYATLVRLN